MWVCGTASPPFCTPGLPGNQGRGRRRWPWGDKLKRKTPANLRPELSKTTPPTKSPAPTIRPNPPTKLSDPQGNPGDPTGQYCVALRLGRWLFGGRRTPPGGPRLNGRVFISAARVFIQQHAPEHVVSALIHVGSQGVIHVVFIRRRSWSGCCVAPV